jgi:hypothetical protein
VRGVAILVQAGASMMIAGAGVVQTCSFIAHPCTRLVIVRASSRTFAHTS